MKTQILSLLVCIMSGSMALAQAPSASSSTPAQSEPKAWNGDLRLRTRDIKNGLTDTRIFDALRARLAYQAEVQEDMTAYLRLATGTSAISANQTLGDSSAPGMQRRSFGLDLAYVEYRPMTGAALWVGKTPNVFYAPAKTQMVFDADIDFEGVSAKWAQAFGDLNYFVNLGSSMVSENYASPNDNPDVALLGAQVGVGYKMFGNWTLEAASYNWDNAQGSAPAIIAGSTSGTRSNGNSLSSGVLASKFNIVDLGLDWQKTWTFGFGDLSTDLFYQAGMNPGSNLGGNAYETGVVLKYGKWSATYANVTKEADSELGAFTDSDTNGGGTDVTGNREHLTYQATKNFSATLTNYNGKRGISTSNQTDYQETQLDLLASF